MRNVIVVLVACSLLCSCSTTIQVGTANRLEVLRDISSRSTSDQFLIAFKPDSNYHPRAARAGSSLIASRDSCFWLDTDGLSIRFARLTDLKSIRFWSQGKGALTGLAVGAASGFALGAAFGYSRAQDLSFIDMSGAIAIVYGVLGGAGGGAIGAIFGGVAGSTTTYIFDP